MDLTTHDIDTLLFDWAIQCCPMLNNCPESWDADRMAVLAIAHKMIDPNFYSTEVKQVKMPFKKGKNFARLQT